jgi:hypothetical protein
MNFNYQYIVELFQGNTKAIKTKQPFKWKKEYS